mgnify:CR=1 FL=1
MSNLLKDNKELMKEYDYDKNCNIDIDKITVGSNKKIWWKCEKGHEWDAVIASRVLNNTGCPYCSGRKTLKGFNDLVTTNKDLSLDWNYEKNNIDPNEVSANSHQKVWWKCSKCNYEWNAEIKSRNQGNGCPQCGRRTLSKIQINNSVEKSGSITETNPQLAKEWNYEKNGELKPENLTVGSNLRVWWKCNKGHEWEAIVSSRGYGSGCPYCSGRKVLQGYNDLVTTNKDLSLEWDYDKNNISPNEVSSNSHQKVWWKCSKCNHKWEAEIKSRNQGSGCPECGKTKFIETRINNLINTNGSLETNYPNIAHQWNYEKNNKLKPNDVTPNSSKKVWWKCDKGHEWEATISSRTTNNAGCPYCANETQTSFAEQTIYYYLKKVFQNVQNRYLVNNQEIDIYLPKYLIGIEYDGARFHNNSKSILREQNKYNILKQNNIKLIRIREYYNEKYNIDSADYYLGYSNSQKNKNLNNIVSDLFNLISELINKKIKVDVNVDRDRSDIYNLYILSEKENSLLFKKPKICKYWNYERNGLLTPDKVPAGSSKKVWWRCEKGHEWQSIISSRTEKSDCPFCLNQKVLKGFNDLKTTNPNLLIEWNYNKNKIKPEEITSGSNKKVWWICQKCNYEWTAIVNGRVRGNGCPNCKKDKISKSQKETGLKKYGSLQQNHPQLLKEWDYDKNKDLNPNNITSSAKYKVWWKCSKCGNEWDAWIADRTQGKGCPECGKVKMIQKRIKNQISNVGSLYDNNPSLVKEWNYEKNGLLDPKKITSSSNKKAWWKCSKCNYEWEAIISSRNIGAGCPKCTNHIKKKVVQYDKEYNFIRQYNSISEASNNTGIHTTCISNVCKGNAKSAGNYYWKYVDDEKN